MESPEALLSERRAILLEHIDPSPTSAQTARRKSFDKGALQELADSIKTHGLVNPILVRPIPTTGKKAGHYELVAGERRFLAAQLAGLERIECSVRHLGDEAVVELQLIENLQRADLHPMHEAESYDELIHKYKHTADEIAAKVGKSRAYVYGRMKLLALSKACRKSFYDGAISASIAEKLARIPVESLQDEALEAVLGFPHAKESWKRHEPMSFRDAVEHIAENFMLDLSAAPFDITDEKLNNAGACAKCPKMTGNQPELFSDVKKGQICTDTVCFAAKTRAHGQRIVEAARQAGRDVITGTAAKKIAPHGLSDRHDYIGNGYSRLVDAKKQLKPGAKITVLQDPKSGRTLEVVHESQIKKPRDTNSSSNTWERNRRNQAAKAKTETAVRRAIFAALVAKGKWKAPPMRTLAELVAETMDWDAGEALMDALGAPEPKKAGYHDRLHDYVANLKTEEAIAAFVSQCHLAEELHVSSYSVSPKCPRLEAAAKAARVDVGKIRRELAPKPKKKAKAARKHK